VVAVVVVVLPVLVELLVVTFPVHRPLLSEVQVFVVVVVVGVLLVVVFVWVGWLS